MKKNLFLFLPLLVLMFSCSQNLPELVAVSGNLVFEYEDEDSHPDMRLSTYVDVSSDVHRAVRLRLECLQNNYIWECENPVRFETGKKKYAGYSGFAMPGKAFFPAGKYVLYYTDANGNEESCFVNINYNQRINEMTAREAESFCLSNKGTENLLVFDVNSEVVFYGEKGDDLNPENIWVRYPGADSFRKVWLVNKDFVLMPLIYRNGKHSPDEESNSDVIEEKQNENNGVGNEHRAESANRGTEGASVYSSSQGSKDLRS